MENVDSWLTDLLTTLEPGVEIDDAKDEIKARILESYRNGLEAGKRSDRKPQGRRSVRV